jgi:hypothetical protein
VAVYAGPLDAVAVMVQLPVLAGAVKSPVPSIEPQEAAQVTGWLAENCCVRFTAVVAEEGVIVIGEVTVAVPLAVRLLPSVAVAVTVQDPAVNGAVKRPVPSTEPQLAPHVAPRLAENCCVPPSLTLAVVGETVKPEDTVTVVEAVWPLPSVAVPVTVQEVCVFGAV